MKSLTISSFICLAGLSLVASSEAGRPLADLHWQLYKKSFGKMYANSSEESLRRSLFEATKQRVEEHNSRWAHKLGFKMGFSHLSDWTSQELAKLNGYKTGLKLKSNQNREQEDLPEFMKKIMEVDVKDLPKEVDWRKVAGRVSSVKNQGHCGSCWAFSTTGVLEGQQVSMSSNGKLIPLSEQNLIDCSDANLGCDGGNTYLALYDIIDEGGIESEQDYPYLDVNGPVEHDCSFNASKSLMSQVKGLRRLEIHEGTLQKFVAMFGPVSASMDATPNLIHYMSGVLNDPTCSSSSPLNHAVLVVGYGTDHSQGDYWLVKNSWSADWGEQGYFRLARNKNNMCGVASDSIITTK